MVDGAGRKLLANADCEFEAVGDLYTACKFRAALNAALALAREAAVAKQLPS